MVTKKEAKAARLLELKKRWKKKYKKLTIEKLPLDFQEDRKEYSKPNIVEAKSAYIYGETGSGKTVLACYIFIQAVKKRYLRYGYYEAIKSSFVNFPELLLELQQCMGTAKYYERQAELLNSSILVLDDLDARRTTDWMVDLIYAVVNHRQKNKLLTIITSNSDLNTLANVLNDDRIIRRIEKDYLISKKQHYSKIKGK